MGKIKHEKTSSQPNIKKLVRSGKNLERRTNLAHF
jgi:hypothetical protein